MAPIHPPALPSAPLNERIKSDLVGAKPTWQAESHIVARNNFNAQSRPSRDPLASVRDVSIEVSHPAGTISCTIYTPEVAIAGILPVLVYFHGGGFVVGSPASHEAQAVRCATGASCVVMSVDYRLAPEFPYPTPVHDCIEAVEWVFNNAKELNIDPKRIAVGGDSAGGNLATVVALTFGGHKDSKVTVCHQLLVYPVTDLRLYPDGYDSYNRNGTGLGLETKSMIWLVDHYIHGLGEKLSPTEFQARASEITASPIVASSEELRVRLGGVTRTHVLTAGHDPLCDEAVFYAKNLKNAGLSNIVHSHYPTLNHGFMKYFKSPDVPEAGEALANAVEELKKTFYP